MEKRHRVFIAINLPEEIKKELFSYSEKWPELPAKWTAKDNLHITLEFLGDLTDVEIARVCKITGEVATKHKSFSLNLNKILYGPPKKSPPRMVWAEGERSNELGELRQDLQECLFEEAASLAPDVRRPSGRRTSRDFSAHITLARIKEWEFKRIDLEERPDVNQEIDLFFAVESIEVMESQLKRGGPVYTVLESCAFGG